MPKKEDFYSSLNMEDITDADYKHSEKVWKDFKIKKSMWLSRPVCSKWYIIDTLHIEIYEVDPAHFLSATGLAWEARLKKIEIRLGLLTDIYMLLIIQKGLEEERVM